MKNKSDSIKNLTKCGHKREHAPIEREMLRVIVVRISALIDEVVKVDVLMRELVEQVHNRRDAADELWREYKVDGPRKLKKLYDHYYDRVFDCKPLEREQT